MPMREMTALIPAGDPCVQIITTGAWHTPEDISAERGTHGFGAATGITVGHRSKPVITNGEQEITSDCDNPMPIR